MINPCRVSYCCRCGIRNTIIFKHLSFAEGCIFFCRNCRCEMYYIQQYAFVTLPNSFNYQIILSKTSHLLPAIIVWKICRTKCNCIVFSFYSLNAKISSRNLVAKGINPSRIHKSSRLSIFNTIMHIHITFANSDVNCLHSQLSHMEIYVLNTLSCRISQLSPLIIYEFSYLFSAIIIWQFRFRQ